MLGSVNRILGNLSYMCDMAMFEKHHNHAYLVSSEEPWEHVYIMALRSAIAVTACSSSDSFSLEI